MTTEGNRAVLVVVAVVLLLVVGAVLIGRASTPSPSSPAPIPSAAAASMAQATPPTATASPAHAPSATRAPTPSPSRAGGQLPGEPDPARTPGAVNPAVTQATIGRTICVAGWTATVRPPASYTTALKRRQIAEYGYADTRLSDYEEDHLIPLEVGGAPSDPANLWPEPYDAMLPDGTPVGARVKDQIENRLRELVCSRVMPLATAQHLIATDWIGAWRRYVGP